jgi:uncharacterized membrane protein
MLQFIKTTVLGGILFLVPVIIFIAIFGKALNILNKLALPIAGKLGFDAAAGILASEVIAIAILVLICFLAGLAAKTPRANQFVRSLEVNVLEKIPVYEYLKTKMTSVLNTEETEAIRSVLARFDDSWQLAFEIERLAGGDVVVFLPGAPDPWSGSVCVVTEDRVTPLGLPVKSVVKLMKGLGKGAAEALPDPRDLGNASA